MIWLIKKLLEDMRGNAEEAKDKIMYAYKIRDVDKSSADWYREMASAHVGFNGNGQSAVFKLIEAEKAKSKDDPYMLGQLATWDSVRVDIMANTVQVQAMISAYK